jgi:hypothetical protein
MQSLKTRFVLLFSAAVLIVLPIFTSGCSDSGTKNSDNTPTMRDTCLFIHGVSTCNELLQILHAVKDTLDSLSSAPGLLTPSEYVRLRNELMSLMACSTLVCK